jgi:hypothetical protein
MDYREAPKPIISQSSSEAQRPSVTPNEDGSGSVGMSGGTIIAFALVGTIPVLVIIWAIRKIVLTLHRRRQQQLVPIHRRTRKRKRHRNDRVVMEHLHCNTNSLETPTTSYDANSEGFQSSTVVSTEIVHSDIKRKGKQRTNGRAPIQFVRNSSATASFPMQSVDSENNTKTSMVLDDVEKNQPTDGDDTITARLNENCVRLQQSIQSPTVPDGSVTLNNTPQLQQKAVQYRRACRPGRIYLDDVVLSDIELGISKSTSRSKRNNTTVSVNDELLYPSQRDPGIISRYFGSPTSCNNTVDKTDDIDCPSVASISSQSSSTSSLWSFSNVMRKDGSVYDDTLLLYEDYSEMGELVLI